MNKLIISMIAMMALFAAPSYAQMAPAPMAPAEPAPVEEAEAPVEEAEAEAEAPAPAPVEEVKKEEVRKEATPLRRKEVEKGSMSAPSAKDQQEKTELYQGNIDRTKAHSTPDNAYNHLGE